MNIDGLSIGASQPGMCTSDPSPPHRMPWLMIGMIRIGMCVLRGAHIPISIRHGIRCTGWKASAPIVRRWGSLNHS